MRTRGSETVAVVIVSAVSVLMILISIIPVYLAHRLGGETGAPGRGGGGGVETEATAVP